MPALAGLAGVSPAAGGADAILPETKLRTEQWELNLQTTGSAARRGCVFPDFLHICSKPEAGVCVLYKSCDAI